MSVEATKEALGFVRQALAKAEPVSEDKTEVITDSDYNLRGF